MNFFKKLFSSKKEEPDKIFGKAQLNKFVKCGCYAKNCNQDLQLNKGLIPLKHIDYQIEIANGLASVTLHQTYINPLDKFLEVQFSFPINSNSCVYKFVAEFDNKRIQGVVKEKEQAKKEYKKAVQQGKRAVIAQKDTQSNDIMNMQIGNIGPKEQVKIIISYLIELSIQQNIFYEFHLPGTISPRYMNNENITKKNVKGLYTWNFKITINSTRKITFQKSQTHDLTLLNKNQSQTQITLVMSKQCIPNKDFTLLYSAQNFHLPSYVFGKTNISSTVMLSFIPKYCKLTVNDAYNASIQNRSIQTDMDSVRCQYIFFLDRSGSMEGNKIIKAVQALCLFLKSLPQDSYFNVVSFGSDSSKLFTQSVKYDKKNLVNATQQIQIMSADMGGTEIEGPLRKILQSKLKEGYPRQVFLLTDGEVSNTQQVIRLVQQNTKFCRVYTIGIGNGASQNLIKGCAQKGKGKFIFIKENENPSQKIIGLLQESLTPVISKIDLKFDQKLVESIVPNPASIPYILKNQVVNFYITFKGLMTQKSTQFKFVYEDSKNKELYQSNITVSSQSQSFPFVDKMSHYQVIKTLQNSFKNNQKLDDRIYYVKVTDKKGQAIKESIKHQILSEFTAFLCVQKQLVDGKYQQIQDKGKQKVNIKNIPTVIYEEIQNQKIKFQKLQSQIDHQINNLKSKQDKLNQRADLLKAKAKQLLVNDQKNQAKKYAQQAARVQKSAQSFRARKQVFQAKKYHIEQSLMDRQAIDTCMNVQQKYNDKLEDIIFDNSQQCKMMQLEVNDKLKQLISNSDEEQNDADEILSTLMKQVNEGKNKSKQCCIPPNIPVFYKKVNQEDDIQRMLNELSGDSTSQIPQIPISIPIAQKLNKIDSQPIENNIPQIQGQIQLINLPLIIQDQSEQKAQMKKQECQKQIQIQKESQEKIVFQRKVQENQYSNLKKSKSKKRQQCFKQQQQCNQRQEEIKKQVFPTSMTKDIKEKQFYNIKQDVEDKKIDQSNLLSNSKEVSIDQVINQQNIDGSWDNTNLLYRISHKNKQFKQKYELIQNELNTKNNAVICTYLLIKWIQKYHNKKEYSLILKKAYGWLQKTTKIQDLAYLNKFIN